MKNIFVIALVCASIFASADIRIIKTDQGPNGFKLVQENHTNNGNHGLSCQDPGYSPCVWTVQPTIVGGISGNPYNVSFLTTLAENQIALGIFSGTIIHNGEIVITWSGSATNYTIIIDNL